MMQADKADAIFAIDTIGNNGYVNGGTAYATTRGIQRGIPVYLFDQDSSTWKVWNNGKFIETSKPNLTKGAAVIGTRELKDNGKQAIESLFNGDKSNNTILDQLVSHIRSIGANVFNRAAMAEFLKTHKIEGLQQFVSKDSLPKGELPSLSSALLTKYNNNTVYGETVHTANYEYTVNYKGAGEFDIIEHHPIDNNVNNNYNDRERKGFPGSLDGLSSRDEITQGEYNSDSYNVEDGEANGNNAGLDKQTSQRESKQSQSNDGGSQNKGWSEIKRDSTTGRIAFVKDGKTISTSEEWNKDFKESQLFMTPQGEVYGFIDKEGNIYLDETKFSPNHAIHEYTHLWDRTVQKKNPKLWQRGIELMKQARLEDGTSLWDTVLNEDNYGKLWQSMNLPQQKLESLIASEIHSRLVGKGGEKLLNEIAKQKGQSGIIGKLKQWILDFWKDLKATFGTWSQEEIDKLEIGDFNRMTVRDLAEDNQACVVIEP